MKNTPKCIPTYAECELEAEQGISLERVKALVESQVRAEGPEMKPFEVDLSSYDTLLPTSMEVAS